MLCSKKLVAFISFAILASCANENDVIQYQQLCLDQLLFRTFVVHRASQSTLYSPKPTACFLPGATCDGGILIEVVWKGLDSILLRNLDWFPPNVQRINMELEVLQLIRTRFLPRDLCYFNAFACKIFGPIDLESLPRRIIELHLRYNLLRGEVSLLNLPPRLRIIDLAHNKFQKVIFENEALPKTLREAHLYPIGRSVRSQKIAGDKIIDSRLMLQDCGVVPLIDWPMREGEES